jgi:hypothetical protein
MADIEGITLNSCLRRALNAGLAVMAGDPSVQKEPVRQLLDEFVDQVIHAKLADRQKPGMRKTHGSCKVR